MTKRFLLVARYYSIEPLGILYLAGAVRDMPGWECKVLLVHEYDFTPLYDEVQNWKPDLVGFQIWTGYHIPAFAACDRVREMGVPVVIGGPHATYFDEECGKHANWVIKGSGFGLFRQVLAGMLPEGTTFDLKGREEEFPLPDRDLVYEAYPELGMSPIKSIFGSVGCPFTCTYCYAPTFNEMHGGFRLTVRPVDDIVAEAQAIQKRWPLKMVYFQDDIFGYDKRWLEEFAVKWKREVGVAFHCQIRLELTRHDAGNRRLDLFREAGCTGITLAIESGNEFLRDRVLFRHMPDELIVEGCKKILDRGMSLRTEQILAVPFSNTDTDLATLDLNNRINPTMAWTSILAPYEGTDIGTISKNFGIYSGNNDDLAETFFDRSVLRHVKNGPKDIAQIVEPLGIDPKAKPHEQPLVQMKTVVRDGAFVVDVVFKDRGVVGQIEFLTEEENERYKADTVRLQRLFNWLAKVPDARGLGEKLLAVSEDFWCWEVLGAVTQDHLVEKVGIAKLHEWQNKLAREMGFDFANQLPFQIRQNPWLFVFFEEGGVLARRALERKVFEKPTFAETLDELGTLVRRHLFHYGLYKIEEARQPIAA